MENSESAGSETLPVQIGAGLADAETAVLDALDRNLDAAAEHGNAPAGNGWETEPLDNFKTDAEGKLILRDGQPIRRGGKPRKHLKPGDRLAGGGVFEGEAGGGDGGSAPRPQIIDPTERRQAEAQAEAVPADDLGEEAGGVLTDALFNVGEAVAGAKARPTNAERAAIAKAAGRTIGGVRLWPPVALAVFIGAYAFRVWLQYRGGEKETKGTNADASNAHLHGGADTQRKDNTSPVSRWSY